MDNKKLEITLRVIAIITALTLAVLSGMAAVGELSYSLRKDLVFIAVPAAVVIMLLSLWANKLAKDRKQLEQNSEQNSDAGDST